MPAEPGNPLGKPRGSLNSPIVATTMAILLGSYCVASLRSARNTSSTNPNANANANANVNAGAGSAERSDSSTAPQPAFSFSFREKQQPRKTEQPAWMQEAIEASREEGKKRAGGK